ncbi:MAG: translation initiation factor IF-2 N-terminal domain-containing protein, partial [Holosporaceae bacterium]|nr:translation initiation factor IF-2 N-terminal domain-containing protein [Holosporaceae bacterium]
MTEQKKSTLSLSRSSDVKPSGDASDTKVRQSFSHGKSKVVVVEVKKKRVPASRFGTGPTADNVASGSVDVAKDTTGNLLTTQEMETRIKVIQDAIREEKEQTERLKREIEEQEHLKQEEIEEQAWEMEMLESKKVAEILEKTPSHDASGKATVAPESADFLRSRYTSHKSSRENADFDDEDDDITSKSSNANAKKIVTVKKGIKELRNKYASGFGRISIYNALDDVGEKGRSLSSIKRAKQKNKFYAAGPETSKIIKEVILPETIGVQELANRMAVRVGEVVKTLMKLGVMVTANQIIDSDTAEIVIMEFGHKVNKISESDIEIGLKTEDEGYEL